MVRTLVLKSAASALPALKWPAMKIRSWREPSRAVFIAAAVHEAGSVGEMLFGAIRVSPGFPVPAERSVWTAPAASARKS